MKLKFFFFILSLLLVAVWESPVGTFFQGTRHALLYGGGNYHFQSHLSYLFYRKVIKPLDTIGNGMDLLREQDFSSRLTRWDRRKPTALYLYSTA